jgi:starch-binding outer membrane protein, SusD/RagB family
MQTGAIKFWNMKKENIFRIFLLFSLPLCVGLSCTKLDTNVYDQVTNLNQIPNNIDAGVGSVYSGMRNYAPVNDLYSLNEVSTDEIIVPIRGQDWADDVTWEQLWKHTWNPNSVKVYTSWQFIYGGIARINSILQAIDNANPKPANVVSIVAAMKTVRAFYYYLAIDMFGNVPIAETNITDLSKLGNQPRAEVFNYIEKELKENLASLPKDVNNETYGRATYWFAQAILAKLYLNAKEYTGTARWTECIAACDAILNSNKYTLEPNFFDNFKVNNDGSRENIFVIPFDINAGLGDFWLQQGTLHYNSSATFGLKGAFGGWGGYNGFCSTAEYYNFFNPTDERRKMFLVGQQYKNQTQYVYEIKDSADRQYDRDNNLLIFDPVIKTFIIQGPGRESAGARCAKWEFNIQESVFNMSNDFAVYRLADIILMKAEAQYRSGKIADALITINQKINGVSIRSRANMPDFTLSEMTADGLLAERARELSWEGWRRNDMIRLGHFTDARIPEKELSQDYRKLYPIPQAEMDKNPYLKQNPGY